MSKSLYQEALLEAQQLKQAAEENATKAVVAAIAPKIREMIESQIMSEAADDKDILLGLKELDDDEAEEEAEEAESEEEEVETEVKTESVRALLSLDENRSIETMSDFTSRLSRLSHCVSFASDLMESDLGRQDKSLNLLQRLHKKMMSESSILDESAIGIEGKGSSTYRKKVRELSKEIKAVSRRRKLLEVNSTLRERDADLSGFDIEFLNESDIGEEMKYEVDDMDEMGMLKMGKHMDMEEMEEEDMVDVDLNELDLMLKLAGLPDDEEELDLDDLEVSIVDDEEAEEEAEEEEEEEAEEDEEEEMVLDLGDAEEEEMEEVDEVYEIDESMLRRELARMRKIAEGNAADMVSHFGGGSEVKKVKMNDLDGVVELKVETFNKFRKESRQNRALRKQVSELRGAVAELSEQLKEQNLFNAKLLYVNKLVHSKSINERQLKSIVESLDGAQTLREVRLLYKGFTDSLGAKKTKSLTESAHRSPGGSSRRTVSGGSSAASNTTSDRWATLAGLADKS